MIVDCAYYSRGVRQSGDQMSLELKGEINEIYRAVHPLLAPLDAMERGVFSQIDPGLLRYFRDIADHVRRIQEEVLAQRDQLNSVLEAHLSLIDLRQSEIAAEQNKIVNRLTLVATVFLPLTFITGFIRPELRLARRTRGLADCLRRLRGRRPADSVRSALHVVQARRVRVR